MPQGSFLGPLLCLLYINDLPNVSKKLTFYLFADNTNIYFDSPDLFNLQKTELRKLNKELRKIKRWLESNRLALNIDKTNFVLFHSSSKKITKFITIKIGRKNIKHENHVCFPGVLLDSTLSWKTHIAKLSKKLSRVIGLFYKIRHYAPLETLMLLYHGLFGSLLSYGIIVWGLTYPSLTEKIYILQKKVVRVITFNSKIAFSTPIFDNLQVLKQEHIFQLQLQFHPLFMNV